MGLLQSGKTLLLILSLLVSAAGAYADQIATVEVSDLNVRAGPGKQYKVLARLPKGAKVRIIKKLDGWLEIDHNGGAGFIRNQDRFISVSTLNETGTAPDAALDPDALKDLQKTAESIEQRLKASETELAEVARKEKKILRLFNTAEEALNTARARVRAVGKDLTTLLDTIKEIEEQSAELEKQIAKNEAYAAQRLIALYKLSGFGRIHLLASAESFFDFVGRRHALEKILKQDEVLLLKLHNDRLALEGLIAELNARKAEKRALELSLARQAAKLKSEQARRGALLESIGDEKALAEAALHALQQAARELDVTLSNLTAAEPPQAVRTNETAQPSAAKSFEAHKGLLNWPVKGKISSFYGPYRDERFDVVNFQSGINIQAERGEPIRAVSDGYTIFSSWFKGFGNMMIIDHGNHYYTVYAHLEEVFKVKGDRVDKDEVIATVGDSGSLTGPALHFEVRHHGKPMDPLKWIKKG